MNATIKEVLERYKATKLGRIPNEWDIKPLKSIGNRITKKNVGNVSENILTISAQHGLVSQTDFFNKKVASKNLEGYYLLEKNDFAYNKSYSNGYPMGAIKSLTLYDLGVVSTLYICFKLDNPYVNNKYYNYYFESEIWHSEVAEIAQEGARNHGLLNIGIKEFFDIQILIPPLNQQMKILEILTTVDEQIKSIVDLIEKTEELKKGLMQQLLTKGIGHTNFKQSVLGQIPVEWEVQALGKIAARVGVGYVGSINAHYTDDSGVLLLRTGNISNGSISLGNVKYVTQEFHHKNNKSQLNPGDLIISRHGDSGSVAIVPKTINEANCLNVVVVKKSEEMNSQFISYLFNSGLIKKILSRTKAGSVQGVINTKDIQEVIIPYPSMKEQQKIVEILTSVDDQIESYQKDKAKYQELKKGLMHQLLTGQLRVTV